MDRVIAGSAAGLVTGIALGVAVNLLNAAGLTEYSSIQIAGSIFTGRYMTDPMSAGMLAVAWSSHLVISMAVGVLLAYLLYYTGRDYGILKGILLGGFFWLFNSGIMAPVLKLELLPPMDYGDLILFLGRHLAFGALSAGLLLHLFWPAGERRQSFR
jgi:hypothetical protein